MNKLPQRKISDRYFKELKEIGHTVPRYEGTGEVIVFRVGESYIVENGLTGETVTAKCTQSSPYGLKLVDL